MPAGGQRKLHQLVIPHSQIISRLVAPIPPLRDECLRFITSVYAQYVAAVGTPFRTIPSILRQLCQRAGPLVVNPRLGTALSAEYSDRQASTVRRKTGSLIVAKVW